MVEAVSQFVHPGLTASMQGAPKPASLSTTTCSTNGGRARAKLAISPRFLLAGVPATRQHLLQPPLCV